MIQGYSETSFCFWEGHSVWHPLPSRGKIKVYFRLRQSKPKWLKQPSSVDSNVGPLRGQGTEPAQELPGGARPAASKKHRGPHDWPGASGQAVGLLAARESNPCSSGDSYWTSSHCITNSSQTSMVYKTLAHLLPQLVPSTTLSMRHYFCHHVIEEEQRVRKVK